MGCGASKVAVVPAFSHRIQRIPRKVASKDNGNSITLNGYVCDRQSGTTVSSINGNKRAGEPAQHVPAVLYTTTTQVGFEARRNAAARQPRVVGNGTERQIGLHDRKLINDYYDGRARCSWRQRRVSAPDRLSGADSVEVYGRDAMQSCNATMPTKAEQPTRRRSTAQHGRTLRVAKLY